MELVLLIAAVALVGVIAALAMPARARSRRTATIARTPTTVYKAIAHVEDHPAWRPSVDAVEPLDTDTFRVTRKEGPVERVVLEDARPPESITLRFGEEHDAYRASWSFRLREEDGATRLRATQRDVVGNPLARLVALVRGGRAVELEAFLQELRVHLEEA